MTAYGSFPSSGLMKKFEEERIDSLVPILESLRSQVSQISTKSMPVAVCLFKENTEHSGMRYMMAPEGVKVVFWDTTVPSDNCLYIKSGLETRDFIKSYVTKLEDATKIARTLGVSLG